RGSYLVNYRYSTLQLLSKLGLNTGAGGVTNFQDLSFNIYLPTARLGDFTLFGFGGLSSRDQEIPDSTQWDAEGDRYGGIFRANTGALGITHKISLGASTYLRSSAALSMTGNSENTLFMEDNGIPLNTYQNNYKTTKFILSSSVNHQFSRQLVL